nr:hypothetical protein Iba_chr13eCG9420 [Ipomoea batatas]
MFSSQTSFPVSSPLLLVSLSLRPSRRFIASNRNKKGNDRQPRSPPFLPLPLTFPFSFYRLPVPVEDGSTLAASEAPAAIDGYRAELPSPLTKVAAVAESPTVGCGNGAASAELPSPLRREDSGSSMGGTPLLPVAQRRGSVGVNNSTTSSLRRTPLRPGQVKTVVLVPPHFTRREELSGGAW